jgi:hypothetical protein
MREEASHFLIVVSYGFGITSLARFQIAPRRRQFAYRFHWRNTKNFAYTVFHERFDICLAQGITEHRYIVNDSFEVATVTPVACWTETASDEQAFFRFPDLIGSLRLKFTINVEFVFSAVVDTSDKIPFVWCLYRCVRGGTTCLATFELKVAAVPEFKPPIRASTVARVTICDDEGS